MSEFTCLLGGLAFSEFQKQKLADRLRRRTVPGCTFNAQFIYFIESPQALAADDLSRLEALLKARVKSNVETWPGEGRHPAGIDGTAGSLLVVPRLGTQSPWSSKATDIAHRCGLDSVSRIERGTLFHVSCTEAPVGLLAQVELQRGAGGEALA